MARRNLRRAAELVEATGTGARPGEVQRWRELAACLVDGYDPVSRRHEQCAGFWGLEPLVISDEMPVPVMADERLGRRRVRGAQVIKQPDVLMLHHLVPDELPAGSLEADLAFYCPRTAHGSSLSLPVHAALLARAGRPDEAVEVFRAACRLDIDNATDTTQRGLHTATAGGVWQALVWGFGGIRPDRGELAVDPRLPSCWKAITINLRFRGTLLRFTIGHRRIDVWSDGGAVLRVEGRRVTVAAPGRSFPRAPEAP